MPKFVLIDHSLKDLGGHHYPYAQSVLTAAQRSGWQPVLVTHRQFRQRSVLPAEWRVHELYSHKSYSRFTLDTQAQPAARPPGRPSSAARWLQHWWATRMRARLMRRFARDTARLFELESIGPGDQIFFATMSELDLSGLCAFLGEHNVGLDCDWHLQFHFGVFRGREPDYATQQAAASAMRGSFARALGQSGRQRLHFYCTTEQLTVQYQGLGVTAFGTLPYPVHELFRPRQTPSGNAAPLRVACLGHSRREKGYGQLPLILRSLWAGWFAPGRAQLVLQTRHLGPRRDLERLIQTLSAGQPVASQVLDFAGFPLPLAAYAQLLCSADVGLMLYDPTRYYARCSGVLLEMLCAGVPVLVPAGGWLADQIEPENQRYLDRVALRVGKPSPCPANGSIDVPKGQRSLLIGCRWRPEAGAGEYLRLEFSMRNGDGTEQGVAHAIVGAREAGLTVRTLLRLPPECACVQMSMHNAWQVDAVPAVQPEYVLVPEPVPMGALGLTIAASSEVPRLLQEVLEHHSHYRECALAHAAGCAQSHSGLAVLSGLATRAVPSIAAAQSTT